MEQHSQRVELCVWREEGDEGLWRCRVMSAGTFHTVRFDSYEALSAYVVAQLELLAGYPDFVKAKRDRLVCDQAATG